MASLSFLKNLFLAEDKSVLVRLFDDGECLVGDTTRAEAVTAALEALFHGDADAFELRARLVDDIDKALHGEAVGHEVVDDEHVVVRVQPLLRDEQRDSLLVGVGEDLALVQAAFDVVALGLLGEEHGDAVLLRADGRKRDAAGLRRQNDSDLAGVEILGELVRNVLEQTGVDAVVEETVDLDDVAGQDSALAADALLKKLHGITPPEKIISDEIFRLKW